MKYEKRPQPTIHDITLTTADIEQAIWEWVAKNTEVSVPTNARLLVNDSVIGQHGIELKGNISWRESTE